MAGCGERQSGWRVVSMSMKFLATTTARYPTDRRRIAVAAQYLSRFMDNLYCHELRALHRRPAAAAASLGRRLQRHTRRDYEMIIQIFSGASGLGEVVAPRQQGGVFPGRLNKSHTSDLHAQRSRSDRLQNKINN